MARRSKRRRQPTRRATGATIRPDWVYRPDAQPGPAGSGILGDTLGTYTGNPATLTAGTATGIARILYDSKTVMRSISASVPGSLSALGGSARAEGARARVHAVRGYMNCQPTTWAVGNSIAFRWRILATEQAPDDSTVILDTIYTSWGLGIAGTQATAATYRNEKRCLAEGSVQRVFSTANDQANFNCPVRWRGGWTLKPEECLCIYMESQAGSVNLRIQPWLSTLVTDEG